MQADEIMEAENMTDIMFLSGFVVSIALSLRIEY